jgi:hypothetical protein
MHGHFGFTFGLLNGYRIPPLDYHMDWISIYYTWNYTILVRLIEYDLYVIISHTRRWNYYASSQWLLSGAGCVACWELCILHIYEFADTWCVLVTTNFASTIAVGAGWAACEWSLTSQLWIVPVSLLSWVSVSFPLTPDIPVTVCLFGRRCLPRGHGYLYGQTVFFADCWSSIYYMLFREVTFAGPP